MITLVDTVVVAYVQYSNNRIFNNKTSGNPFGFPDVFYIYNKVLSFAVSLLINEFFVLLSTFLKSCTPSRNKVSKASFLYILYH